MKQWRNQMLVTVTLAGVMLTSACQGEAEPEPLPPAESSTTAPVTPSSSPAPAPAWESKYTPRQLRTYESALRRYQEYETKSEPIWRAGKANARTEHFFKEYFFAWPNQQRLLALYEENEVQIHGTPAVLRSQPTRVAMSDEGESVTIKQCVNFNASRTIQYGKETKKLSKRPQVRIVTLSRFNRPDALWRMSKIKTFQGKRPCSAAG